jgi:RNA polymerase sigma-70 factor (ECF subfamily)
VSDAQERFEQIFNSCHYAVCAYAIRRVAPEAVQDVVSETFLVAWRRYAELDGEPLPWLFGIARRVVANQLRGSARRDALRKRLHAEPRMSMSGPPSNGRDPKLLNALSELSARDREALMLIAWEELDHRAAASVMGCSTTAFSVRVHRARRKLANALRSEESESIQISQRVSSTS